MKGVSRLVERLKRATPNSEASLRVSRSDIERVAISLQMQWPASYVEFIESINGVEFPMWEIYRISPRDATPEQSGPFEIVACNRWLHEQWQLPSKLIAFHSDGLGNATCFDAHHGDCAQSAIVRFVHDGDDPLEEGPATFEEWLVEEIERLEWLRDNP